jgi:hypothetical protein
MKLTEQVSNHKEESEKFAFHKTQQNMMQEQ